MNSTDSAPNVHSIQKAILERICLLDYKAGQPLKEADIATEFNVSRTPVRDALSRIAHLELIEARNGVGTVVKQLSNAKIDDVYQTRLRLAPMIGEMSVTVIGQTEKIAINNLLSRAQLLTPDDNVRQYIQINHDLHQVISGLISNSVLRSFWRQTYFQAASIWYRITDMTAKETLPLLVSELSELVQALENNDLVAVGHIQRVYIGYGYARIQHHLFMDKN